MCNGVPATIVGTPLEMVAGIEQGGLLLPAAFLYLTALAAAAFFRRCGGYRESGGRMGTHRGSGGKGKHMGSNGAGGIGLLKALYAHIIARQVNHSHSNCPDIL